MPDTLLTCRYYLPALHVLGRPGWSPQRNREVFGPCSRLHGHDYYVEITLGPAVGETTGLLVSRDHLNGVVSKHLLEPYWASLLNNSFDHTTGEALAIEFFKILGPHLDGQLIQIAVQETAKNRFIYRPTPKPETRN